MRIDLSLLADNLLIILCIQKGKKKDPNAPKRPSTGFFIWLAEHRADIKADNPGLPVTGIGKIAGERWKKLSDKSVSFHQKLRLCSRQ